MVARGGIEPPTRGFSVAGTRPPSPPVSRRLGRVYPGASARVAPDRTHADLRGARGLAALLTPNALNELLPRRPNWHRPSAGGASAGTGQYLIHGRLTHSSAGLRTT